MGALALTGGISAAGVSFLLSRSFLRLHVSNFLESRKVYRDMYVKINRAVEREGFKLILLIRLAPLFPFSISNYILGLSRVRHRSFLLATALGFAPGTCTYVYLAATARAVVDGTTKTPLAWLPAVFATALLTAIASRIARRAVEADDVPQ